VSTAETVLSACWAYASSLVAEFDAERWGINYGMTLFFLAGRIIAAQYQLFLLVELLLHNTNYSC